MGRRKSRGHVPTVRVPTVQVKADVTVSDQGALLLKFDRPTTMWALPVDQAYQLAKFILQRTATTKPTGPDDEPQPPATPLKLN